LDLIFGLGIFKFCGKPGGKVEESRWKTVETGFYAIYFRQFQPDFPHCEVNELYNVAEF